MFRTGLTDFSILRFSFRDVKWQHLYLLYMGLGGSYDRLSQKRYGQFEKYAIEYHSYFIGVRYERFQSDQERVPA